MPASFFRTADRNGDGSLTPAELQADIRRPDILYSDHMRLTLGGKTVDLIYPGKNHSDDATVLYFPAERVVFAVDDVAVPAVLPGRSVVICRALSWAVHQQKQRGGEVWQHPGARRYAGASPARRRTD